MKFSNNYYNCFRPPYIHTIQRMTRTCAMSLQQSIGMKESAMINYDNDYNDDNYDADNDDDEKIIIITTTIRSLHASKNGAGPDVRFIYTITSYIIKYFPMSSDNEKI